MDPVRNPFTPGAGRPPAALVGRDEQLNAWRVALERIQAGRSARSTALYGLRGTGKTVLLRSFRQQAEARGWIVAQLEAEAGKSLREALAAALHGPLSDVARPGAGRQLVRALQTAASFRAGSDATGTWTFGIDLAGGTGGGADTGALEADVVKLVRDLSAAAEEEGVGLAILIDEAQHLSGDELIALCATVHAAGQNGWRCVLALAGLPSLPRELAAAKSYAERLFAFAGVQQLPQTAAREALIRPAEGEGVFWKNEALEAILGVAGGYPYFLQQYGQETWNAAPASPISLADARVGAASGRAALDEGFFRAGWDRATRTEKRYLRALAAEGEEGADSSAVAGRLGRHPRSLSPARASLIGKGLIYAPERGVLAFTGPGMADFIRRQPGR